MKIQLLPYKEEYVPLLLRWRNQPLSVKHNPLMPLNIEKLRAGLLEEGFDLHDLKAFKKYRFFIEANGEVCGSISLKEINLMMNSAEIGYQVNEDFHGRGIMTAALRVLLDRIFEQTPLRRIMAFVHDQNIASCRVLEKLGFHKEGLLREHFIINGKPENEFLFAILKSDWAQSK